MGYERANIREDREIATRTDPRWRVDGVAFFDRLAQAEHASVTILDPSASGVADEETANRLRLTTAPFHLIFNQPRGRFVLWAMGPSEVINLREDVSPDGLSKSLQEFAYDLSPRTVQRVKQGVDTFRHPLLSSLSPIQLTFWAEQANGRLITEHFGHALDALQTAGIRNLPVQSKIAAQLLAARILIDTDAMEDCQTVGEIPEAAEAKNFREYFDRALLARHRRTSQEAYDVLRNISLATFQPDMLRHLYRSLYSEKEANARGRFDTPLWLTRRIWQNIPVEFLRPEDRVSADLTCGWGSFLISGVERLSRLPDMANRRLCNYVFGNDNDNTTKELARVALLTSTGRDNWQVSSEDALRWQLPQGKMVNVIVGNPPFFGDRKLQLAAGTGGKRYERANEFLDLAVDLLAPGGFLAMVMPGSFVASEAGPKTRRRLLDSCDIIEIWDLPTGIFEEALVQPMVIFAKKIGGKVGPSPTPVRIRNLQRGASSIAAFKELGAFSSSSVATNQQLWTASLRGSKSSKTTHVFQYTSILSQRAWDAVLERTLPLRSVARIVNGCIPGNPERNGKKVNKPVTAGWLTAPLKTLPGEFRIDYGNAATVAYPNDLEWPRYDDRDAFEQTKILLVADPNPSWGRRVKIAIERRGYFVSNSFYVVAPLRGFEHLFPEVIAAVLRWKLGNAWLLERLRYPWLNKRRLEEVPFPKSLLEDGRGKKLETALRQIECAAISGDTAPRAESEINGVLKSAYGIDPVVWERLTAVYQWDDRGTPEENISAQATWISQGEVIEARPEREEITIWLNAFSEPQIVPIASAMPGWLLRPEAKFITKVPGDEVRAGKLSGKSWGGFEPEQFTYLSLAEGARAINSTIAKNKESGR